MPPTPPPARRAHEVGRRPPEVTLRRERQDPVRVEVSEQVIDEQAAPTGEASRSADGRHGLFVVLEDPRLDVVPGASAVARLTIRNTGAVVERVDVRIAGVPATWVTFDPPSVNLDVNAEAQVRVVFHPPRTPDNLAGPRIFEVRAWCVGESASAVTAHVVQQGVVSVEAFGSLALSLDPPTQQSKGATRFAVLVSNQGNTPVDAAVEVGDPQRGTRLHASAQSVSLAAGASGELTVDVVPAKRILTGSPKHHRLSIGVTPRLGPPVQTEAVLTQLPLLPRWAPRVAAVLLLVAMGGGVLLVRDWLATRDRPVPNVASQSVDSAKALLLEKGFGAPEVLAEENPADPGIVVRQEPKGGVEAPGRSKVKLFVSSGPKDELLPSVVGKTIEVARQELAKFVLQETAAFDRDVAKGNVISQEPAAQSLVKARSGVTLTVSMGPEQVTVPDLQGKTRAEINVALTSKDLNPVFVPVPGYAPDSFVSQTPPAETSVDKGSKVTVEVGAPPIVTVPPAGAGGPVSPSG